MINPAESLVRFVPMDSIFIPKDPESRPIYNGIIITLTIICRSGTTDDDDDDDHVPSRRYRNKIKTRDPPPDTTPWLTVVSTNDTVHHQNDYDDDNDHDHDDSIKEWDNLDTIARHHHHYFYVDWIGYRKAIIAGRTAHCICDVTVGWCTRRYKYIGHESSDTFRN